MTQIFCDGSCLGNPGRGGWAALLVHISQNAAGKVLRHEKLLVGSAGQTTNNRMELSAAIHGLLALQRPVQVEVFTDSNYVVQGMTSWVFGWSKKNWRNSKNQPVENRDLWEQLLEAARPHQVRWTWVKGHAGHPENERVDQAARAAAAAQSSQL